jgi:UDP-N-acetylmuramoylalanine--D-glutamate ligase
VIAAAESFPSADGMAGPLVLIVGGQSRGVSYDVLNDYLCRRPGIHVIAIPTNGTAATAKFAAQFPQRWHAAPDLVAAVRIARTVAGQGGTVVLSPGAPSFDFYRNYADKSRHFADAIANG